MATENLYHLLGIPDYSEIQTVKKVFRQLALKYHPDRNSDPAAAETFKTLVKTYEILSNPQLKEKYDHRLKTGYDFPVSTPNQTNDSKESRMKRYARMRKEMDAMEEIENLNRYEASLSTFSFKWRMILCGLLLLTAVFTILDGWYEKGSTIAFGEFLFVAGIVITWNEIYKQYWYQSITKEESLDQKSSFDSRARNLALKLFLGGLLLATGLIQIKKVWHLHFFGKVIFAHLETENNRIIYDFNNKFYTEDTYIIPEKYKFKTVVYIKISTQEPSIWEYAE